jgi:hypothetical protein
VDQVVQAVYRALVPAHGPQVQVAITVTAIYHLLVAQASQTARPPAPVAPTGGFTVGDRVIIQSGPATEVFTIVGFPQRGLAPGLSNACAPRTALLVPYRRNGQPWRGRTRERSLTMLARAPDPALPPSGAHPI